MAEYKFHTTAHTSSASRHYSEDLSQFTEKIKGQRTDPQEEQERERREAILDSIYDDLLWFRDGSFKYKIKGISKAISFGFGRTDALAQLFAHLDFRFDEAEFLKRASAPSIARAFASVVERLNACLTIGTRLGAEFNASYEYSSESFRPYGIVFDKLVDDIDCVHFDPAIVARVSHIAQRCSQLYLKAMSRLYLRRWADIDRHGHWKYRGRFHCTKELVSSLLSFSNPAGPEGRLTIFKHYRSHIFWNRTGTSAPHWTTSNLSVFLSVFPTSR
jgi:hypothetical protein